MSKRNFGIFFFFLSYVYVFIFKVTNRNQGIIRGKGFWVETTLDSKDACPPHWWWAGLSFCFWLLFVWYLALILLITRLNGEVFHLVLFCSSLALRSCKCFCKCYALYTCEGFFKKYPQCILFKILDQILQKCACLSVV